VSSISADNAAEFFDIAGVLQLFAVFADLAVEVVRRVGHLRQARDEAVQQGAQRAGGFIQRALQHALLADDFLEAGFQLINLLHGQRLVRQDFLQRMNLSNQIIIRAIDLGHIVQQQAQQVGQAGNQAAFLLGLQFQLQHEAAQLGHVDIQAGIVTDLFELANQGFQ
jgi:hypothetical protein